MKKISITPLEKDATARLLKSINDIYGHKLLQAKGFKILADRAKNNRFKEILQNYSDQESSLAEFWFKKIKKINGAQKIGNGFLRNIKTKRQ